MRTVDLAIPLVLLLIACSGGNEGDTAQSGERARSACVEDLAGSLQDQSQLAATALAEKAPEMIGELRATLDRKANVAGRRAAYANLKEKVSETGAAATAFVVEGKENTGKSCPIPRGASDDEEFLCWAGAVRQHERTVNQASLMIAGPLQDVFDDVEALFRAATEGAGDDYRAALRRIRNDLESYSTELQIFSDLLSSARDRQQECV